MKNSTFKKFTIEDIDRPDSDLKRIFLQKEEVIDSPLPCHKQGPAFNSSGYGKKIPTPYKIHFEGKLYRIYVSVFGNAGSAWIQTKQHGKIIIE